MADSFEEIALHQSIIRRQWLPLDVAVQELITFEKLFGSGHFLLACHAALPSLLTPELLHSIRLNFLDQQKPGTPWIAEMDFLLSPLCRPVEKDVFEVEPMAREALLFKLEERYGWTQLQYISDFLLQYLHKNRTRKHNPALAQLHTWIALSYLQPDKVVQELLHLLNESVDAQIGDYQTLPKKLRVARTMELLAEPLRHTLLQAEYTSLIHSARVLAYTLYNNKETFPTTIRATASPSGRTGTLFPPAVQQWLSTITVPQRTKTGEANPKDGNGFVVASSPDLKDNEVTEDEESMTDSLLREAEQVGWYVQEDSMLKEAGWLVQKKSAIVDVHAAQGIAIRNALPDEYLLTYHLFVDGVEVGVIEVAQNNTTFYDEESLIDYPANLTRLPSSTSRFTTRSPLPFAYRVTGSEIEFTNALEPETRSRRVFHFHRPETLAEWLKLALVGTPNDFNDMLRSRLRRMPRISPDDGVIDIPIQACAEIEKSLAANHPRVLVYLPDGKGKTETLLNLAYGLLAFAHAQRILYLVRNSVDRATYRRFERFSIPGSDARFTERFNVHLLQNRSIDPAANICIATVEQFYSAFSGVQIIYNEYRSGQELSPNQEHGRQSTVNESINIQYNPSIPIEFFDIILIDDCASDTYRRWRPMLEYFDTFIVGATSNTDEQELAFFHNNLVYRYEEPDTLALASSDDASEAESAPEEDEEDTAYLRFSNWLTEQDRSRETPFTEEQILWLERIYDRIISAGKFEERDFNRPPFQSDGGLTVARFLFGNDLSALLQALNELLGSDSLLLESDPIEDMGDMSQSDLEALLSESASPSNIKRGDVVEGIIMRIDRHEILVDIGLKSEAILSPKELPATGYGSFNELHLNDRVFVYVLQPETSTSRAILSLKRGNIVHQWRIAEEQYKNGELFTAKVIDFNKGGLIVDVAGIRGFVPVSQIRNLKREEVEAGGESQETAAKLQSMHGQELRLKIIELNQSRNRLVLSERLAAQEWRQRRLEQLLDELQPGDMRRGVVNNLADFGAFVDLGGADGLVHISQIAFSRIKHPGEILHIGQEVAVKVLGVDKKKKSISLSIKQADVDPWTTVEQRYTPGQIVNCTVTKLAPFGAFARIEDGIEGLIHTTELPPGSDPKSILYEGAQLQLRILRIDAEHRRIGLSLRQVDKMDEPTESTPSKQDDEDELERNKASSTSESISLETLPEPASQPAEESRKKKKRRKKAANSGANYLPLDDETTAMAEAFREAAQHQSPEEEDDAAQ